MKDARSADGRRSLARPLVGVLALALAIAFAAGVLVIPAATAQTGEAGNENASLDGVTYDPAKVVGTDRCAECHAPSVEAWKQTPHFQTWTTLHRKKEAREIAEAMGVRSIKRGDVCLQCHYTRQEMDGRPRPIAGVSCESCHGPARDWIDVHNDFGGEGVTKDQETPEHREKRIAKSVAAGMNPPTDLYAIAQNCFSCHTVPNEKLVNTGGHQAGSAGFELVAWSQGMVRHNFARTGQKSNQPSGVERLRLMYVVGAMADLEYSLRALALAKAEGGTGYAVAMAKRTDRARKKLKKIHAAVEDDLVGQAVEAGYEPDLKLNNEPALSAAADRVAEAAKAFSKSADGSDFEALDPMLPDPASYNGEPFRP